MVWLLDVSNYVALVPALGWLSSHVNKFWELVSDRLLLLFKDASSADIRKAYRKLSLVLHPDKNKDENAETQFRQVSAICGNKIFRENRIGIFYDGVFQ